MSIQRKGDIKDGIEYEVESKSTKKWNAKCFNILFTYMHNTYVKQVMEALIVESNKMINTPFVIIRYSNYDMQLTIKIENLNFFISINVGIKISLNRQFMI